MANSSDGWVYILLFELITSYGWLGIRFVPLSKALDVSGAIITTLGVAFAIWARSHLGTNWSARVSIRQNHELIRCGPYRVVRHPIYTGMILAAAGTALAIGEVRGLLALAICFAAFYLKARNEERWLTQEFGPRFEAHTRSTGLFFPRLL